MDEIEKILSRFKKNKTFICAFLTACYTGMRTGEVFALTWNDIDLESRIIKVNKTVYAKNKNPIGRWYIGTTKTEGSEREIYICDTLYSILFDYKEQQDRNRKKFGKKYKKYSLEKIKNKYGKVVEYVIAESKVRKDKVDMVFTKNDGTYSGTDVIKYPFKIIRNELGIKARFYDLRGSFATTSLRNGCEIKDIAEVLGHRRIETTEKYYISSTEKDKIQVAKSFEKSLKIFNNII
ncbi:MAG: site-specific integrase [Clostridia bacterium]|nr:site-specific integrase [Clostridia bacterium]